MDNLPFQMPKGALEYAQELEEDKVRTQQQEVARIIDNFDDDFMLSSWGYTRPLKITRGDKVDYIKLKIKSVGVAEVQESVSQGRPRPPSSIKTIKKNSPEAQALGSKHDVVVREIDESDPVYQQKLAEHDQSFGVLIMLAGLAYDIKDKSGEFILKGADVNQPSTITNKDVALAWLKARGVTGSHYSQIVRDIRSLTEDVKEEEDQG